MSHHDGEAKFWLAPSVQLAKNASLSESRIRDAQRLVEAHRQKIINAWSNYFSAEVTNVSGQCLWILVDDKELVTPYSDFPWFKGGTIEQVGNFLRPSADHIYWPDLDVDLSVASIRNRGEFPLIARITSQHQDPAGRTKDV